LGSLREDSAGLAGATTQFYSVARYMFDYRFVDELFIVYRYMGFFSYQQVDLFCFYVDLFSFLAMCSFQYILQSKCIPKYFTASV